MNPNEIFFNSVGRLRSGWRVTIFAVSYLILTAILGLGAYFFLICLPFESASKNLISLVTTFLIFSLVAVFLGWLFGKFFEDLPFRALGCSLTKNWLRDLILGLIFGAVMVSFAALIAFAGGGLKFEFNQTAETSAIYSTLGLTLLIFIAGAISEETFFRGYILQTFFRSKLAWFGTLLTSLLFAFAHRDNPGSTNLALFNTLAAGVWFAVAYYKTRNLWFPFGLHLTWNWFQGAILGINVSGLKELAPAPLFQATDVGPTWLTGGSYGIEGGIACTITLLLAILLTWTAPFLKPNEELLALTSHEIPQTTKPSES